MIEWIDKGAVHSPRVKGKIMAIVADNNDPKMQGRLKLTIPAILGKAISVWAMPVGISSGVGIGNFEIPSIGAMVWAEFEHGDVSRPIWTLGFPVTPPGTTSMQIPPEAVANYPNTIVKKTKAGHVVIYENTKGQEKVIHKSFSGHTITFDDVLKTITTKSAGGHSTTIDDGNSLITHRLADGTKVALDSLNKLITISLPSGEQHIVDGIRREITSLATTIGLGDYAANVGATGAAITKQHLDAFEASLKTQRLNDQIKMVTLLNNIGTMTGAQLTTALLQLVVGFLPSITTPVGSIKTFIK